MFKHTKIGVTIGPACDSVAMMGQMVKAGMNFARLNFAHGSYPYHASLIKRLRAVEKTSGEPLAILQDLQGPRIRIGDLPEAGVAIKTGETVVFDTAIKKYTGAAVPVDHPELHRSIKPGERVLIDDGKLEVKIQSVKGTRLSGTVTEGGTIFRHKGINLPDSLVKIPALSQKDRDDLRFGIKHGVDMIGMSFVSSAEDINEIRRLIAAAQKIKRPKRTAPVFIIAKIERHEAVKNLKEIITAADGIMVARGDLGLELPKEDVPLIQKRIIDLANAAAKPVIVATQMLNSMQTSRRPTRAEVSDVANAVIDHADALLLTNETAAGTYPVETVQTMSEIIVATEKSRYDDTSLPKVHKHGTTLEVAITELSRILAEEVKAKLVLVASITGGTGRLISQVRPSVPILVATESAIVTRQLNISWGVKPFVLLPCVSIEQLLERSLSYIKQHKLARPGDKMIVVAGEPVGQAGHVNLVEVREIK